MTDTPVSCINVLIGRGYLVSSRPPKAIGIGPCSEIPNFRPDASRCLALEQLHFRLSNMSDDLIRLDIASSAFASPLP